MIPTAASFLVVVDQPDNRALITRSLLRKFPGAHLTCREDSESAEMIARDSALTAAIVHRASDADGLPLIEMLRTANPVLPLILISSADDRAAAFDAGASAYLTYDSWVRIGAVVEDVLRTSPVAPFPTAKSA